MSRSILPRWTSSGMYFALFLFMALFTWSLLSESAFLRAEDDAYFYCRIADSVVETGRLSFDGLTSTNGFHPLWMGLLILLRFLISDPHHLLKASAVLSLFLMTTAGLMTVKYCLRRYSPVTAVAVLFLLVRYVRDFSCMAMETSLLIPLAVLALILTDRLNSKSSNREIFLLGVVLALAFLARLDSLLLVSLIFVVALKRTGTRSILFIGIPVALSVTGYLIINEALFAEWFSVSASMKASGLGINSMFARQLFLLSDPMGLRSPWGLYLLFLVLAVPCCFSKKLEASARISSVFLVFFTVAQLFLSQWRLWYWYAYPAVLFLIFAVPPVLEAGLYRMKLSKKAEGVIASVLLMLTVIAAGYWAFSYSEIPEDDFRYRNMVIAQELNELLPESTVVAMGDRSGSFAYFFKGHVIQAEGLAGDLHLAEAIQSGQLEQHLHTLGTEYILSWTGPHRVENYDYWEITIPDKAQASVFNNTIQVQSCNEVRRWEGENESVFLWRFNEN